MDDKKEEFVKQFVEHAATLAAPLADRDLDLLEMYFSPEELTALVATFKSFLLFRVEHLETELREPRPGARTEPLIKKHRQALERATPAPWAGKEKGRSTRRGRGAAFWKNDPALTYFRAKHYHRLRLLDCRVRNGNGYFQTDMGTGSCLEIELRLGGLVESDRIARDLSENEVKPIDWLVPVG